MAMIKVVIRRYFLKAISACLYQPLNHARRLPFHFKFIAYAPNRLQKTIGRIRPQFLPKALDMDVYRTRVPHNNRTPTPHQATGRG